MRNGAFALTYLYALVCSPIAHAYISDRIAKPEELWSTISIADDKNKDGCTAAKIGGSFMLTAAHCVSDREIPWKYLSGNKMHIAIGPLRKDQKYFAVTVKHIHVHPIWAALAPKGKLPINPTPVDNNYDEAIIEMRETIPEEWMPTATISPDPPREKESLRVGGFGCSELANMGERRSDYRIDDKSVWKIYPFHFIFYITIGEKNPSRGCSGDSGGPIYRVSDRSIVGMLTSIPALTMVDPIQAADGSHYMTADPIDYKWATSVLNGKGPVTDLDGRFGE